MTIYKTVDKSIASLCKNSINGDISIGEFQTCLLENISQIVSLEDKQIRNTLYDLEAELDSKLALYYGAIEIGNLNSKFLNRDEELKEMVEPIIQKILSVIDSR